MLFKNILVPLDGSDQALHSAEIAVGLAAQHGGKIHLLHIIRPSDYSFTGIDILDLVQKSAGEIIQHAEDSLKSMAEEGNVAITSEVAMGNPASIIVKYSKGFDSIVIASRGLTGLSEILLGSVSNVVSHHAHCPVLLIRN